MKKRPIELKAGDRTAWYTVVEDAERGTLDDGPCILAKVQWDDGGIGFRVWKPDPTITIEVES